jgi:hypothetical protein
MTTTKIDMRPISSFAGELITALEFIRVAQTHYPKATDMILNNMDLADEAFLTDIKTLGDAIGFDFNDDGTTN